MSWATGISARGAARTGKHHAVARAGQPPPHREADLPCTEDSYFHVYLLSTHQHRAHVGLTMC